MSIIEYKKHSYFDQDFLGPKYFQFLAQIHTLPYNLIRFLCRKRPLIILDQAIPSQNTSQPRNFAQPSRKKSYSKLGSLQIHEDQAEL